MPGQLPDGFKYGIHNFKNLTPPRQFYWFKLNFTCFLFIPSNLFIVYPDTKVLSDSNDFPDTFHFPDKLRPFWRYYSF